MNIGIIDCGGANLNSIYYSFKRLGINTIISNSVNELSEMNAYVLPGVGSADIVMNTLRKRDLINFIKGTNKPILGICIGMQILFDYSEENQTICLGIIDGDIEKFNVNDGINVPQMGWNKVECDADKDLNGHYYFANSYFNKDSKFTIGYSSYGNKFSSIIKKDNILGCQFHPEKSSKAGERFLTYFIKSICS
jgi:glutamine amidotransferase